MRIAVISDVHGNRFALEAVLGELRAEAPDAVVNLGDQVHGGADPAGALALQRGLGAIEVRGNNEEKFADAPEGLLGTGTWTAWTSGQAERTAWVRSQVGETEARRLAALPLAATLADGEVLAAHGSPGNAWRSLFEVWEGKRFLRPASDEELLERAAGFPGVRVVVVGHSHKERLAVARGVTFVNVGAVSWQTDGDPAARWALLERRGGAWSVSFRRVRYDVEAAVAWARAHGAYGEEEEALLRSGG